MPRKHIILLVHGIRTHASWYERAQQVFAQLGDIEIEPIKYGRFDLFRFLIPGPWRRGPIDRSEDRMLPIIDRVRKEGGLVSVIAHSNGTNVVATLLKESYLFKIDNLILCGSVIDTDFDWEGVSHKVSGKIINDYGVRDIWPAVAKSFTWGYGYSGTNGFGAPVKDRLHDTTHSAYFSKDFMEKYWISFFRDGSIVRPEYGDVEIPESPWWFYFFEVPWKWVIVALLGLLAFFAWSGGGATPDVSPGDGGDPTTAAPATATPADGVAPAPTGPSAETTEGPALSLACDRGSYVVNLDELGQLRSDADLVNTATWVNIAIGELGQREFSGDEANPRILAYMATAEPKFASDEQPWNSQFVNYVMNRAGKTGTNSGLARSWLSWGKDAIAEVGEPVVGSVVVTSRDGVPGGGVAGFYLGSAPDGGVRVLAGNICKEVSIVSVPESKILGYRLPSDWLGPAQ
ncbi:hypothetical protein ASD67_02835 [Sphingopyxis sp. Root1497]|uniref:TIGR02594 family protein n=1 Tax=Sphingopyxis sp. Root1497 TaxID=1736474 RepID=UPI0006F29D6B|nr:TIGR02594 family protein [Sphingopyxis sp. Root1497]KQZ65358.1 hypothetical protein ASD67_02835 [Sphingopyxis sp. Root1497]